MQQIEGTQASVRETKKVIDKKIKKSTIGQFLICGNFLEIDFLITYL